MGPHGFTGDAVTMPTLDQSAPEQLQISWLPRRGALMRLVAADALAAFRHGWTTRQLQLRGSPRSRTRLASAASWLGVEREASSA